MLMVDLEVEADAELNSIVNDLALRYFGDGGDVSRGRVLEVAFRMRCLWSSGMEGSKREIEEPVVSWEFPDGQLPQQPPGHVTNWLFRRRQNG